MEIEPKISFSRIHLLVAAGFLILAGSVAILFSRAAKQPVPTKASFETEDPVRGLVYRGLNRQSGRCGKGFEIQSPIRTICTHGPDPAPVGRDVRTRRSAVDDQTVRTSPDPKSAFYGLPTVNCDGDGQSGQRIQAVYVHRTDKPDRYASFSKAFQIWAIGINQAMAASSAETGKTLHYRFATDAACAVSVVRATISPAASVDMNQWVGELTDQGLAEPNRKYLVWTDDNVYCGLGLTYRDDRAGLDNPNNTQTAWARVDNGCWGMTVQENPRNIAYVETHELMHTLGAIQDSAPHSTGAGHCTDDYDVMCYVDISGKPMVIACTDQSHETHYDCNHDDYFNTSPTAGSYLATHWNSANSAWLAPGVPPTLKALGKADSLTGGHLVGWAFDPSEPNPAIQIKVTVDGQPFDIGYSTIARSDINTTYGITGAHGFDWTLPSNLTTGSHQIYVYAVNAAGTDTALVGTCVGSDCGAANSDLFRFFNTKSGEHFFTAAPAERDNLIATAPDWHYEGVGFSVYPNSSSGNCLSGHPLDRVFNTKSGYHLFTISATEKDYIIAHDPAWHFENVGFCADKTAQTDSVTIYRFFNTINGQHFFTGSIVERNYIQSHDPAWHYEGTAFYVK